MYRTICAELWTDPAIDALDSSGKLLFVYLITNPHTHLSGIYHLKRSWIVEETKLSDRVCDRVLDTLSKVGKASYDGATQTIFVTEMFRYQGKGEKNERSAAHHLATLHHSSLIGLFLERYPSVKAFCSDRVLDRVSGSGKRCPSVPDPDSDPVSSSVPVRKESERTKTQKTSLSPERIDKTILQLANKVFPPIP